jgi:hypothetical protein
MASSGSLGTLSVDVIGNIAQLVSDLGQAQQANQRAAQQMQRDWESATGGIKDAFVGLAEVIVGAFSIEALKSFAESVIDLEVKSTHLAETFGISLDAISAMNAAATVTGKSLEDVTGAMTRLERASAQAQAGAAKDVEAFRALGITVQQLQTMKPDALFQSVAVALTGMEGSAKKTANAVQLFGRNISEILPILRQMAADAHLTAQAYGTIITPEQSQRAEAFQQALGHVKLAFQGVGQSIIGQVLPAFTAALNQFALWVSTSDAARNSLTAFANIATEVADHMQGIVVASTALAALGIENMLAGWATKMASVSAEAGTLRVAMAAVGTSAVAAVQLGVAAFTGWQIGTWARENFLWVDKIGPWIVQGIEAGKAAVVAEFTALWTAAKGTFDTFIALLRQGLAAPFQSIASSLSGTIFSGLSAQFQGVADSISPATSAAKTFSDTVKSL